MIEFGLSLTAVKSCLAHALRTVTNQIYFNNFVGNLFSSFQQMLTIWTVLVLGNITVYFVTKQIVIINILTLLKMAIMNIH